jgi:hypothetical protein
LVVEYYNEGGGWTASARADTDRRLPTPVFGLLMADLPVESDELGTVAARSARALIATWSFQGDMPQGPEYRSYDGGRTWTKTSAAESTTLRLSLWIDTASLRPLLWDVSTLADTERAISGSYSHLFVRYVDSVRIQPPPGVPSPECIPVPPSAHR